MLLIIAIIIGMSFCAFGNNFEFTMVLINTLLIAFLQVHVYGILGHAYVHLKINYFRGHGDIDDSCVLKCGRIGRCVDVDSCPGGREKLQQFPGSDLCGFFYSHPIVCCEFAQQPATPRPWPGSDPNQNKPTSIPTTATTMTTTTTEVSFPTSDSSGIVTVAAIGGEDALPLEFPHMAVLGYGDPQQVQWRCGGSLINENFVMTAAHCIQRGGQVRYVVLGAHQLSNATNNAVQAFRVNNTYIHPQYVNNARYHDIALIELDRPVSLVSGVMPARLHTSKDIPSQNLVATGWGATEVFGDNSDILQKVNLTYVPFETCERSYRTDRRLPNGLNDDWQLCADGGGERRDTCQGDSGGPLQVRLSGDQMYTIIGVTSLGLQCATVPAVYTRVSNYVQWIRTTARLN